MCAYFTVRPVFCFTTTTFLITIVIEDVEEHIVVVLVYSLCLKIRWHFSLNMNSTQMFVQFYAMYSMYYTNKYCECKRERQINCLLNQKWVIETGNVVVRLMILLFFFFIYTRTLLNVWPLRWLIFNIKIYIYGRRLPLNKYHNFFAW